MTLKALMAAVALAATLAAPAGAQTLRWAAQNDILTMDPHSQNHATTNAILMHAYEGLTRYSAKSRSNRPWPRSGLSSARRRCVSNCARA